MDGDDLIQAMTFSFRLMLAGIFAVLIGGYFLADAFAIQFLDPIVGGLWWKGGLLVLAGIGAVVMGIRMRRNA